MQTTWDFTLTLILQDGFLLLEALDADISLWMALKLSGLI